MTFLLNQEKNAAVNLDKIMQIYFTSTVNGTYILSVDTDYGSIEIGKYQTEEEAKRSLRNILNKIQDLPLDKNNIVLVKQLV